MPIARTILEKLKQDSPDVIALDLSSQRLTKDDIAMLSDALKHNTQLKILDLSDNLITEESIEELKNILVRNINLILVNVAGNKLPEISIPQRVPFVLLSKSGMLQEWKAESYGMDTFCSEYEQLVGKLERSQMALVFLMLGCVYQALQEKQKAIDCYNKVIELSPKNTRAYEYLAITKFKLEKSDEAITALNRAININFQYFPAYFLRGFIKRSLNKKKEAMADFEEAIRLNPDNPEHSVAYDFLGWETMPETRYLKAERGVYEAALRYFDQAIRLAPNTKSALYGRAKAKSHVRREMEAVEDCLKALELDPEYKDVVSLLEIDLYDDLDGKAFYVLGQYYARLGVKKEREDTKDINQVKKEAADYYGIAIKYYHRACEAGCLSAFPRLIWWYANKMEYNKAEKCLDKMVRLRDEEANLKFLYELRGLLISPQADLIIISKFTKYFVSTPLQGFAYFILGESHLKQRDLYAAWLCFNKIPGGSLLPEDAVCQLDEFYLHMVNIPGSKDRVRVEKIEELMIKVFNEAREIEARVEIPLKDILKVIEKIHAKKLELLKQIEDSQTVVSQATTFFESLVSTRPKMSIGEMKLKVDSCQEYCNQILQNPDRTIEVEYLFLSEFYYTERVDQSIRNTH